MRPPRTRRFRSAAVSGSRFCIPKCVWRPPNTEWNFTGDITRMPEFTAPALGNRPNLVTIEADIPANANGVLYKLGANSGGLTLFVEDGILCYEYNLFIIMRTKIRATQKLPVGKAKIEVETVYVEPKPGWSAESHHQGQRQAIRHRRRSGQRCLCCSPRTTASTSASPWARPFRSTTTKRCRSSSTERLTR